MSDSPPMFPGAKFYKADLHIHTPASRCWKGVKQPDTMKSIFQRLHDEGIEIAAITDHNSVAAIEEGRKLAKVFSVHLFPGVEVSTKEGHVLAIFDPSKTEQSLNDWLARLGFDAASRGDDKAVAKDQDGDQLSITKVFELI